MEEAWWERFSVMRLKRLCPLTTTWQFLLSFSILNYCILDRRTIKHVDLQANSYAKWDSLTKYFSPRNFPPKAYLDRPNGRKQQNKFVAWWLHCGHQKIYRNIQEPPEQASTIHAPCARQILKTSVSRGNISIILALRAFLYFRFSLAPHSYKTHQIPWVSFFTEHINSYQRKDQSKIASSSDSACFAGIKFVWERSQIMHRNYSWLIRQSYHMQHQYDWHPAIRASFFRLHQGEEKAVLPETRQAFEVATIQTSRLVDLVPSRQTSFSGTSIRLIIYR